MELRLSRCTLRPWRRGDVEALVRHADDREVWINLRDLFPHPYTRRDARRWIRMTRSHPPGTTFAIEIEDEACGGIGIKLGDDVYCRSAEIGYWLGRACWGRGVATEAVTAVTEHALARFDLSRVWAAVFSWNPASMRVLEKAGYRREGVLRNAVTKDGRTGDQIVYAVVCD